MDERPSFLTGKDLAQLCRVSLRTVETWRLRKMGPPYKKMAHGAVLYPFEPAATFVEKYTGSPIISISEEKGSV